jgi:hypothetical protein
VLARVPEHVAESVPHLARRREHALVEAIGEHLALPRHHAIDRPRDPDREPLHAPRQRLLARRLGDQVNVVALHRDVDEAGAEPILRAPQRTHQTIERTPRAEAPHVGCDLERHQHRLAAGERGSRHVRHTGARSDRLPPRSGPLASASMEGQLLLVGWPSHARRTTTTRSN